MADQKNNGGGFVKIPWYVVQKTTDAELKTLAVLTHYCSMQGGGFPSIETIAREAGKRRRAISTALDSLTGKGFIVKSKRKGQTSVYSFPGKVAKPQEPPADHTEETAGTYAENCIGTETGNLCRNLHTTYAENCIQNKIDLIRLKQEQEQEQGHKRTRTREKSKKSAEERKHLESLITFQVKNPNYKPGDDENRVHPFTSAGIDAIYQAGLKIGYRMTVAEVYKFAFAILDGGITNRKGIFHPIRDFDSLLYSWRDNQTPEAARQAVSEQQRLKAGEKINGGEAGRNWRRNTPFPELSDIDPIQEHTLFKTMKKAGFRKGTREEYVAAENAFDSLPNEEQERALKVIPRINKQKATPTDIFNQASKYYWKTYEIF